MKRDMYALVARNCSSFYPRSSMFTSSIVASDPTCMKCRYFENQHCVKDLYDEIADNFEM